MNDKVLMRLNAEGKFVPLTQAEIKQRDANPAPLVFNLPPDNPTLSDWRVGLTLWRRDDGTLRIDEVSKKVADLVAAENPIGRIARERLEYANNVLRAQLLQLRGALGFSEAEIDESLWRAEQVRRGDLSGQWPLPTTKGKSA